jgi:hypothetical protein
MMTKVDDSGFFQSLLVKGREYVIGAVITVVGGVVLAALYSTQASIERHVKQFAVEAVAEDLKATNSVLAGPLAALSSNDRVSEVGELNSGHFVLSPENRTYSVALYFPPGYKGTLAVKLSGDFSPTQSYVVLGFPEGDTVKIASEENLIKLTDYFQLSKPSGMTLGDLLLVRAAWYKQLQVITFQLEGPVFWTPNPSDRRAVGPNIEVTYLARISPAIKVEP